MAERILHLTLLAPAIFRCHFNPMSQVEHVTEAQVFIYIHIKIHSAINGQ